MTDRARVIRAVDQNSIAEVESVFAEMTFDHASRGIGRRNCFAFLDVCPVRLPPNRVLDLSQYAQAPARRVKEPDPAAFLQQLLGAGRGARLRHHAAILKQVSGVGGDVDRDHGSVARCFVRQSFDLLRVALAELPPMAWPGVVIGRRLGFGCGWYDARDKHRREQH